MSSVPYESISIGRWDETVRNAAAASTLRKRFPVHTKTTRNGPDIDLCRMARASSESTSTSSGLIGSRISPIAPSITPSAVHAGTHRCVRPAANLRPQRLRVEAGDQNTDGDRETEREHIRSMCGAEPISAGKLNERRRYHGGEHHDRSKDQEQDRCPPQRDTRSGRWCPSRNRTA